MGKSLMWLKRRVILSSHQVADFFLRGQILTKFRKVAKTDGRMRGKQRVFWRSGTGGRNPIQGEDEAF